MSVGITGGSYNHIYNTKATSPTKWVAATAFTGYQTSRIGGYTLDVTNGVGIVDGKDLKFPIFKSLRGIQALVTVAYNTAGGDEYTYSLITKILDITFDPSDSGLASISVGDYLVNSDGELAKVLATNGSTTISLQYFDEVDHGDQHDNAQLTYYKYDQSLLKSFYGNNQTIMGYSTAFRSGLTSNSIVSGSTTPNRDNNRSMAVRTRKVGTAIRAGYWNEYDGVWSTPPSTSDDSSTLSLSSDTAPGVSKVTFTGGAYVPTQTAYSPV